MSGCFMHKTWATLSQDFFKKPEVIINLQDITDNEGKMSSDWNLIALKYEGWHLPNLKHDENDLKILRGNSPMAVKFHFPIK